MSGKLYLVNDPRGSSKVEMVAFVSDEYLSDVLKSHSLKSLDDFLSEQTKIQSEIIGDDDENKKLSDGQTNQTNENQENKTY